MVADNRKLKSDSPPAFLREGRFFILAILVLAGLLTTFYGHYEYRLLRWEKHELIGVTAAQLQHEVEHYLDRVESLLRHPAIDTRELLIPAINSEEDSKDLMRRLTAHLPEIEGFALFDGQGRLLGGNMALLATESVQLMDFLENGRSGPDFHSSRHFSLFVPWRDLSGEHQVLLARIRHDGLVRSLYSRELPQLEVQLLVSLLEPAGVRPVTLLGDGTWLGDTRYAAGSLVQETSISGTGWRVRAAVPARILNSGVTAIVLRTVALLIIVLTITVLLMLGWMRCAERLLRNSEARLRTILNGVQDAIISTDENGLLLTFNSAAGNIFGYCQQELVGRPVGLLLSNGDRAIDAGFLKKRRGSGWQGEMSALCAGGRRFSVDVSLRSYREGKQRLFIIAVHDLSLREDAKKALGRSEDLFRIVAENIRDVLWVSVPGKPHEYVSPSVERVWGRPAADFYHDPGLWMEMIVPEDRERLRPAFRDWERDRVGTFEYRVRRPDGKVRWIRSRTFAVPDRAGRFGCSAGVAEDITALKLEQQKREARFEAQRQALIKELHHRMKNNLQGLLGLLSRHAKHNPTIREPMLGATGQIRALAAAYGVLAEAKEQRPRVCVMVEGLIENLEGWLRPARLHYRCVCPPYLRVLEKEAAGLALIVNELLFNALKHGAGDSKVNVTAEIGPGVGSAMLRIDNHGVLPEGFDFSAGAGCGTGLDLVRSLMPGTGAHLEFDSSAGRVTARLLLYPPVVQLVQQEVFADLPAS